MASYRDIHAQFRTLHEADKPFLGLTDLSCFFAVWGRGWCNLLFNEKPMGVYINPAKTKNLMFLNTTQDAARF